MPQEVPQSGPPIMPSNVRRILVATCLPPIIAGVGEVVAWAAQGRVGQGAFVLAWAGLAGGCVVGATAMRKMQGTRVAILYAILLAVCLLVGLIFLDCVLTTMSGGVCDA
jgi:hypothetical protein